MKKNPEKEAIKVTKIKICGITDEKEADYLNEAGVDYAGIVQFVPKSKRNIPPEKAVKILNRLKPSIHSVAVTISPTVSQLCEIERMGFSIVQIHGQINEELFNNITIPIIKAFNVDDLSEYEYYKNRDKVMGFIFDAQTPGSGNTFDWSLLNKIPKCEKISFLAGGLNCENVAEAIAATKLDGVDISSGVENDNGIGKNREKIIQFVKKVRSVEFYR